MRLAIQVGDLDGDSQITVACTLEGLETTPGRERACGPRRPEERFSRARRGRDEGEGSAFTVGKRW